MAEGLATIAPERDKSPISAEGVRVICSTPTTSTMRARFDSMVLSA